MNPTRDYKVPKFKGEVKGVLGNTFPTPLIRKLTGRKSITIIDNINGG